MILLGLAFLVFAGLIHFASTTPEVAGGIVGVIFLAIGIALKLRD